MSLDFSTLEALRRQHPAWRLLAAEHVPLVASFLRSAFFVHKLRPHGCWAGHAAVECFTKANKTATK